MRGRKSALARCGVRQHAPPGFIGGSTASGKNRIAAALFALFLGGVGIHKFYLGRVGQGILYLLFCWTFIPAIIGFIEGIIYLTMSDASFEEKYINIPTETTSPDTIFPLNKRETGRGPSRMPTSFVRSFKSPIVWGPIAIVVALALIGGGTKPAVQPPLAVQAATPMAGSDGCDLAGAIPNCKAVMAELAAKSVKGTGRAIGEAASDPQQEQAHEQARAQAQDAQVVAGKPWRQWSEDEMTEFMRRALIICVHKQGLAEHDCYAGVNTIAEDWKAHHG